LISAPGREIYQQPRQPDPGRIPVVVQGDRRDNDRTFPKPAAPRQTRRELNENFLNAELFADSFLGPMSPYREKIGVIMFEFSRFYSSDFERGRHFVAALDVFLGRLPKGRQFGVELRNPGFLQPDYFAMLRNHGVTHVFNARTQMPTVNEQIAKAASRPTFSRHGFFCAKAGLPSRR
jgi:uncharacterized protein YecE (DUF72 family)